MRERQKATGTRGTSRSRTRLGARLGGWWGHADEPGGRAAPSAEDRTRAEHSEAEDLEAQLGEIPELLDGESLPNGVVELMVEGVRPGARLVFDVHDGRTTTLDPGSAVPWASISGTVSAWRLALGPQGDVSQLWHTGDPHLAERVLGELERLTRSRSQALEAP